MKFVRAKHRDGKSRPASQTIQTGDDDAQDDGALGPPIIRVALENWPAAAVLIDHDGRVIAANRAVAKLFGYRLRALHLVALTDLRPDWRPLERMDRDASVSQRITRRHAIGQRIDGASFPLRFSQLARPLKSFIRTISSG